MMHRNASDAKDRVTTGPRRSRYALAFAAAGAVALGIALLPSPTSGADGPAAHATQPKEDELLVQACRYLKLSPTQLRQLIPIARTTEKVRAPWEREEAAALRELRQLGEDQPDASAQIRKALGERRERVAEEITGFAAPQLVRLLTREQIALAWRLHEGTPPEFARQDAVPLLDPTAGFAGAIQGKLQLLQLPDLDTGFLPADPIAATVLTRASETRRLVAGLEASIAQFGRVISNPTFKKPFPQLVVETSDLRELLPALIPLTRRLFLSSRWLPALHAVERDGLTAGLRSSSHLVSIGPLRLLRDYRMERGYRDMAGHGPELEPLGGGIEHGVYQFDPGQGLKLENAGVTDHYALQVTFRYFGGDGYQKILDFKEGAEDGGLYLYQGHLTFYTHADGGVPVAGREHRLRLERNRKTRVVRAYLDLRPIFAFLDLDNQAVFNKGKSLLFIDDRSTKTEQGPGSMRSVAIWGAPAGS